MLGFERINGTFDTTTITLSTGATGLTSAIDVTGYTMFALQMSTGWDAASIGFYSSLTQGGTYQPVYDDAGSLVSVTVAASECVACDSVCLKLAPLRFIKLWSQSGSTTVAQSTNRTIGLIMKG